MSGDYREYGYDVNSNQLLRQMQEDSKEAKEIEQRAETAKAERGNKIAQKVLDKDDITEDERERALNLYTSKEFEYLVDGAVLKCDRAMLGPVKINLGNSIVQFQGSNFESAKLTRLRVKENKQNSNGLCVATVGDAVKGNNIIPFKCNCSLLPDRQWEIDKIKENIGDCKKYGTCSQLMDLNDEWENMLSEVNYFTYTDVFEGGSEEKEGINMMSILFCKHGGLILPVTSGQLLDNSLHAILMKDRNLLIDEELRELGYLFQTGNEIVRSYIFDYLFPTLDLNGSLYGETELARHIDILNTDPRKIPEAAEKYVYVLNTLGLNENNYSVAEMINILSWNQDKINKTHEVCREYSIESGILLSPKMALAIIGAEGTGSYDTNGSISAFYNNGHGPQHDFDIDTKNGLDLVINKLAGFIVYRDEYESAAVSAGVTNSFMFTYLCQRNPILGKNKTGVYAENNFWIEVVTEKYQKYSKDTEDDERDYIKDYEIFFEGYDKNLIENKDDVQYEFINEGGKVVVYEK